MALTAARPFISESQRPFLLVYLSHLGRIIARRRLYPNMVDDLDLPNKSQNGSAQTISGPPTLLTLPNEILLLIAAHLRPITNPTKNIRLLGPWRIWRLLQRRWSAPLRQPEKLGAKPIAIGPAPGRCGKYGVERRGKARERCAGAVSAEDSGRGQSRLRLE